MVVNSRHISIPDTDVPARLRELLARIAVGEQVTITTDGRPVARIMPAEHPQNEAAARAAVAEMRQIRQRLTLGGLKVKDLMNEGRR